MSEDKADEKKDIGEAIKALTKKYGQGAVITSKDDTKVEAIPTGCYAVDNLLGCGGLPRGRIIEVFGAESSGKSTLALFFISQIQKQGGKCVFIDAENAFDKNYAEKIGVDVNALYINQPATLEEAMDVTRAFVSTNGIDIIVVDSVAALVPAKELEGEEMLKDSVADQARLMNKALRILTGPISRSKTIVIFINQVREKIGVFYGKKESTPGGKALKFYSSVRLEVSKGERKERGEGSHKEQIGNVVKVTAVKNKVGFPWRSGEFTLYYGSGVDLVADALAYAIENGIVERKGNTYSYEGENLGVGEEKALSFFEKKPDAYQGLRKKIDKQIKEKKDKDNGPKDQKDEKPADKKTK
jgi:recombination protein RecA